MTQETTKAMPHAPKQIRCMDSHYRVLFSIQDGESITITSKSGKKTSFVCQYKDDFHTQIGKRTYEVHDFAEKMYQRGATYMPTIPLYLPEWCYTVLPSSGELVTVEFDVHGYGKLDCSSNNPIENRAMADKLNLELGVYPQQEAAMRGGSMFGWDTPAARVTCYNMQGESIPPTKQQAVSVTKTGVVSSQSTMDANFLHTPSDAFAIYQLKDGDSTRNLRFEPLSHLQQTGETVDQANYQCVYTAPLPVNAPKTPMEQLHVLYEQLNIAHPADFTGHSLSVSDVVALNQNGQITCYYIDRWSFEKLPSFLPAAIEKRQGKPTVAELLKPKPHSRNSTNQLLKKNAGRDSER